MASNAEARAAARELVDDIASKYGHVDEATWARTDPNARRRIQKTIDELRKTAGSAISTLAKNVYSSNARFVFELLQNADDNKFNKALARNEEPYVAFRMYHDRIIVDCNEDGFTEANLRAICSVGQSSKTGEEARKQGYVGEKGIGFKSVFKVARRVHINSGDFSFYFDNDPEDTGLKMICPIWEEPEEELPHPMTRMILQLHRTNNPESLTTLQEAIREQFHSLQDSLLLFLKKLRKIKVTLYDENDNMEESIQFSRGKSDSNRITLTRRTSRGSRRTNTSKTYYVVTHTAGNLAKNENRSYSDFEEQTKTYSQADVVLAFPLTPDSTPIIEQQDVFAFLPMRHEGFSFVINSDFVTEASRQGLVTTSQRNLDLLCGICDAFIKAALEFCEHDKLRYTWMRFLPNKKEHRYDHFWSRLVGMLEEKLRFHPLVLPWSESTFRLIPELYPVPGKLLDDEGMPLFRDKSPETYLSKNYKWSDLEILSAYGRPQLGMDRVLELVALDLESPSSVMKSKRTDKAWHKKAADLISSMFESSSNRLFQWKALQLPLIPLRYGRWVSAFDDDKKLRDLYFSSTAGNRIPGGLNMLIIHSEAEKHADRAKLFKHLGARTAEVDFLREQIFSLHRSCSTLDGSSGRLPSIRDVSEQLEFLYLTHHLASMPSKYQSDIVGIDHLDKFRQLRKVNVYMPDDHEFGPKNLLNSVREICETEEASQTLFLNDVFLENTPESPSASVGSWQTWLCGFAGVQRYLPLIQAPRSSALSDVLLHVQKYRPDKVVGFLRHSWAKDGKAIEKSADLKNKLRLLRVTCDGGETSPLSDTYLPTRELRAKAASFLKDEEYISFLRLPGEIDEASYASHWGFLVDHLGVQVHDSLDFYVDLAITVSRSGRAEAADEDRITRLYHNMYMKYSQDIGAHETYWETKLEEIDSGGGCFIYVPPEEGGKPKWVDESDCLWKAPSCFSAFQPLECRYKKLANENPLVHLSVQSLFTNVWGIGDCEWDDVVEELRYRRENGNCELESSQALYSYLHGEFSLTREEAGTLRQQFEDLNLIYVPGDDGGLWVKPSQCLWASETRIQGKTILSTFYEDLYELFVTTLGVDTLNLEIVYNDILKLGSSTSASIEEVKRQIWVFNGFLQACDGSSEIDAQEIRNSRIFPVRFPDGNVELRTCAEDFAIVDRVYLGEHFCGKVKTLYFTFDETIKLSNFLDWLGLEPKYMSKLVKEISSIDSSGALPVPPASCAIRPKAHALCRIASHYGSPRLASGSVQDLHTALQDSQVFQTNGISSVLHLNQDGTLYTHTLSSSDLHIRQDEEEGRLQIYIPRKAHRREACFAMKLPSELFEWMMTDPDTNQPSGLIGGKGTHLVSLVLNNRRSLCREILEGHGVGSIDLEEPEPDDDLSTLDESLDEDGQEPNAMGGNDSFEEIEERPSTATSGGLLPINTPTASTPDRSQRSSRSVSFEEVVHVETRTGFMARHNSQPAPLYSVGSPVIRIHSAEGHRSTTSPGDQQYDPFNEAELGDQVETPRTQMLNSTVVQIGASDHDAVKYQRLLERVVAAARAASFPNQGSMDMSTLIEALSDIELGMSQSSYEPSVRFPSVSRLERDKMIGAAGELYVFELLKELSPALYRFSMDNWQSTIRDYVNSHPEYRDIQQWYGTEKADIMYDDTRGAFTQLLIDHGFLARSWRNRKPKYFIEVKSTTGVCETPFYMSRHQYRRIQEQRNSQDEVYLIFRVFNLGMENMGLRLYVDPAELEASGQLVFTATEWSVVPGRHVTD